MKKLLKNKKVLGLLAGAVATGALAVMAVQRSNKNKVVVEFTQDPDAA
jgi:hypothetical protein